MRHLLQRRAIARRIAVALKCIIVVSLLLPPHQSAADQDPMWRWHTIETDHFRVHYYEGLDRIAERVARIAERAHANLVPELGWEPRRPTHLVLVDDSDDANGITFTQVQNVIRLWAVGPEDQGTLEDFDDWLTLLIHHEYTHLLHIDHTQGFPTIINAILGEVYHPNHFTPRWLLEGFAIYEESLHQPAGGRVRSSMFDMYLRMAVLEGTFYRLDQVTNQTRGFPQGTVPYLYGQDFVEYVSRRHGPSFLADLAEEMSDDPIPYALNRAFRRVTGHTVIELWEDWRRSLEVGYRAVARRVRAQGLTDSRQLTDMGERTGPPRFSPDGRTIFLYHASEDSPSAIWAVDAESGERRRVSLTSGNTFLSPSADGRHLVYARFDRYRVIYQYHDLFRLDLESGVEERLTDGVRANAVDVSSDGRRVAYTSHRSDSSDLWVANAEIDERRRVIESQHGDQVYSPRFSPDGQTIAVSVWNHGGYRDIELVDVSSGDRRRLMHDQALDTSPCFSPDGRWLVYSSDRTGIANLYAYDLEEERLWQVTNVVSGAYMPDLSPDGEQIAFVGFSSRGFDLHVMPFDPSTFREPAEPIEELIVPPDSEPEPEPEPEIRMRHRRYSPWSSLAPRSWMAGLGQDAFGQAIVLTTYGQDATEAHLFQGRMTVGLGRGDVGYDLSYQYSGLRPDLTIRHARWVELNESFRVGSRGVDFIEENFLVTADISLYLGRGVRSHQLWAGYELRYSRPTTDLMDQEWDPGERMPRLPTLGLRSGIYFGWLYSNARSSVRGISPETGRSLRTSVEVVHPVFGSDYFQVTFRYLWAEYILMPWRRHHVLALNLEGGISGGDLTSSAFSLGGYPQQDLIGALLNQSFVTGAFLRGYPYRAFRGSQYHMLNMEYRFPIWNAERGLSTLPLFLSHLWLSVFCDVGGAFAENLDFDELLVGVGAEIMLRVLIGHRFELTFRLGYARGLMEDGENTIIAHIGAPW